MMRRSIGTRFLAIGLLTLSAPAIAGAQANPNEAGSSPNTLTDKQREAGWRLLFNGENADGWQCHKGESINPGVVEGGALQVNAAGCHYIYYAKRTFDDFVLRCQVRQADKDSNSGIFLRIANPKQPLATGFEVQVYTGGTDMHSLGAIYDLVPARQDVQKPAGQWNQVEIRCEGPKIQAKVNGRPTARIDTRRWTTPGQRPDGSEHKFDGAIAERPQSGYIMLQDHKAKVWYRNIMVKPLE